MNDTEIDLPFYDPDPRSVLAYYQARVKKEDIPTSIGSVPVDPQAFGLAIVSSAEGHLKSLRSLEKDLGLKIKGKARASVYLELLAFWHFRFGSGVSRYLQGEQFTLYVLEGLVQIMDFLRVNVRTTWWLYGIDPFTRRRRANRIEKLLGQLVVQGEDFYIRDKLDQSERASIDGLVRMLAPGEENPLLVQLIKLNYRLLRILGKRADSARIVLPLHVANSSVVIPLQKSVINSLQPVWKY